MSAESVLDAATIRRLLDYDPATGVLTWKSRPREMFTRDRLWVTWNKRRAGKPAGTPHSEGYIDIVIRPRRVRARRAAFAIMEGWMPEEVDHINRLRSDNRWKNLRHCSQGSNLRRRLAEE